MRKFLYKFLYFLQVRWVYSLFIKKQHAVILAYHRVCPIDKDNILLKEMIVDPSEFENQMKYLVENYNMISLEELANAENIKKRTAVITFDDAYLDNYDFAYPILKKYNIKATVFVPTGYIESDKLFFWEELCSILNSVNNNVLKFAWDNKEYLLELDSEDLKQNSFNKIIEIIKDFDDERIDDFVKVLKASAKIGERENISATMTWAQMMEMKNNNISFGAHTHLHASSGQISDERFLEEIKVSKEFIDEKLEQDTTLFAYPFGADKDIGENSKRILSGNGYSCAVTMEQGLVFPGDDEFAFKRIGIGGHDSKEVFRLKISGLIPAISKIKKKLK